MQPRKPRHHGERGSALAKGQGNSGGGDPVGSHDSSSSPGGWLFRLAWEVRSSFEKGGGGAGWTCLPSLTPGIPVTSGQLHGQPASASLHLLGFLGCAPNSREGRALLPRQVAEGRRLSCGVLGRPEPTWSRGRRRASLPSAPPPASTLLGRRFPRPCHCLWSPLPRLSRRAASSLSSRVTDALVRPRPCQRKGPTHCALVSLRFQGG